LRDAQFVFHWDIGGGARMITNEKRVDYQPMADRHLWYDVSIKR